jgi:hypothetical protein
MARQLNDGIDRPVPHDKKGATFKSISFAV